MARIKAALISVSDKRGVVELAQALHSKNVKIISTGGTARELRSHGVPVTEVSEVTGFPEIMNGRIKSIHPAIHAGILARRDRKDDMEALKTHNIEAIDMVVVNLYPFAEQTGKGVGFEQAMEQIDIGGPTLLRGAAKNFIHVAPIVDPDDYTLIVKEMALIDGDVSIQNRLYLARKTFEHTAVYDSGIYEYLTTAVVHGQKCEPSVREELLPDYMVKILRKSKELRYGENPHQTAALYVDVLESNPGWADAEQLSGKSLSYNNYLDMNAAWNLVSEFKECCCAIIKHGNPCGVAIGENSTEAYRKALETDPDSAFGAIITMNRRLTARCAREIYKMFVEVVMAPDYEPEALKILKRKKKQRLIRKSFQLHKQKHQEIRDIEGAYLFQGSDTQPIGRDEMKVAGVKEPDTKELDDLLFAWKCVKHVKSNAIVLAKNKKLLGIGAGQMSRVDSVRLAVLKARESLEGAVMASDAFLPFRDALDVAVDAGVTALIQPGGSIRDEEVVSAANERGISMIFTGIRHFRH